MDRSKVPDYRIRDVIAASQPTRDRVWRSESGVWVMKKGRNSSYNLRVDRAVQEAMRRGFAYEADGTMRLRPTEAGLKWLNDHEEGRREPVDAT